MDKPISKIKTNRLDQVVFLGPLLLCFVPIVIIPFIYAVVMSFMRWNGISSVKSFIGFLNYHNIVFEDPDFWRALMFSIKSTVAVTIIANIMGLCFAVLICSSYKKMQGISRTVLLLPNIMGGIIMGFIWKFIFQKGFPALSNLPLLGFLDHSWLGDPVYAFWSIVIVSCWQYSGYTMIIYIAGLVGINNDIIEASLIDGCSGVRRFFSIKLPLIMHSITICVFWVMVKTFTMYDLVSSLTEGGPFKSTATVSINLYEEAFRNNNYGLGSAKAIIFFIFILVIAVLQVRFTKSKEVEQ